MALCRRGSSRILEKNKAGTYVRLPRPPTLAEVTLAMSDTAADPHSARPFPGKQDSLLNREKFPVSREFRRASHRLADIRCISQPESSKIKGLSLIFFGVARARTRARPRNR